MQPHTADDRRLVGRPGELGDGPARRMRKLLVKVTLQGSVGPVQVVMSAEDTVADLIKAVVELYKREKRRPLMDETDEPASFQLHYSPFSLECLDLEEKLGNLDSRNFFVSKAKHEIEDDLL